MGSPRYKQIKSYILSQIESGVYVSGSKIPTEAEFAKKFSVSRMTVNKAIRDLAQSNVLIRHAGVGTFVSDSKAESPLTDVKDIAEEVRKRGRAYSCRVLKLKKIHAHEMLAMQMGVPVDSEVFRSIIIHYEDDFPIQIENRYVNVSLVPDYSEQDFTLYTPHHYLSNICPISKIEHIVEAVVPSESIVALLKMDEALPCLQVNRRTWSDGRLVSYACLTHPGDRYKLRSVSSRKV